MGLASFGPITWTRRDGCIGFVPCERMLIAGVTFETISILVSLH